MNTNKAARIQRSRLLMTDADVFTHNAWDNVDWTDEQLAHAAKIVEAHNEFASESVGLKLTNPDVLHADALAANSDVYGQSNAWNEFYSHHHGNFFKKRQWLPSEFPELFQSLTSERAGDLTAQNSVRILETGCGAGATVVSLLEMLPADLNPQVMLYCCDISANAVMLLRNRLTESGNERRCHTFQADISANIESDYHSWPCKHESIDFILLLYTLSALNEKQMPQVMKNIYNLLRPGGIVLFRDYGMYDLAQLRFKPKQCLGHNFYQRGDGTTTYFFTSQKLDELFVANGGFEQLSCTEDRRLLLNRKRELKMYRVWLQAKYRKPLEHATMPELHRAVSSDAEPSIPGDRDDKSNGSKWRAKKVARILLRLREKLAVAGAPTVDDDDAASNIVAIYNAGMICGFSADNVEKILHDESEFYEASFCVLQFPPSSDKNLANFAFILCDSSQTAQNLCRIVHGQSFFSSSGRENLWVAVRLNQMPSSLSSKIEAAKTWSYLQTSSRRPNGLILVENFISLEFERDLLGFVEYELNKLSMNAKSVVFDKLKRRTALHFGSRFVYGSNSVDNYAADGEENTVVPPMPSICIALFSKLARTISAAAEHSHKTTTEEKNDISNEAYFNQLTINVYEPGGGIPAHTDIAEFGEYLVSLSLESDVVMDFERTGNNTEGSSDSNKICLILPARSLLVLSDDARWQWTHAIESRKCDLIEQEASGHAPARIVRRGRRCSFTFRHVLAEKAELLPPNAKTVMPLKNSNDTARVEKLDAATCYALERRHVQDVYDQIAQKFSATRYKAWPRVAQFLDALAPGSLVLDAGCGNGKYVHYAASKKLPIFMLGFDFSAPLVDISRVEAFQADILNIPLRSESFDAVICIAVLHHLSSHERRALALRRLLKCLRVGGTLLVYVWAFEQRAPLVMPSSNSNAAEASKYLKSRRGNEKCPPEPAQFEEDTEKQLIFSSDDASKEKIALPLHTNRTQFKHQDVLVPFSTGGDGENKKHSAEATADSTFYRFYHVFACNELEKLCADAVAMDDDDDTSHHHLQYERLESYYDQGNWCVILRRTL